jgi:hypothetical protein
VLASTPRRVAWACAVLCALGLRAAIAAGAPPRVITTELGVGPQYDSTHVYVTPADLDAFVASFVATFGGHAGKPVVSTVTPTASSTQFQYIMSPVGTISTFAYSTPIPYPFGLERTGYLVTDMNQAVAAARAAGASILVEPFKDPIGIDAVVEWPGGVKMQLYWHFVPPSYEPLAFVPENRIYVAPDRVDNFAHAFIHFSRGRVISDEWHANGAEIGKAGQTYRRIRLESKFGKMQLMATDGQIPYPFGYEINGYEVGDLNETLAKARAHGASVLVEPIDTDDRRSALVKFPGGYIAEIHSPLPKQAQPVRAGKAAPVKLAVFDFELEDTSPASALLGKTTSSAAAMEKVSSEARRMLAQSGRYSLIDVSKADSKSVAEKSLRHCDGCEAGVALELGAEQSLLGVVTRVTQTDYYVLIEIRDARTGKLLNQQEANFAGGDDGWASGARMLIKHQILVDAD